MTDEELIYFSSALDRCWLDRRFDELAYFFAPDVVLVAPEANVRLTGLSAVIDSYRSFMSNVEIETFAPGHHRPHHAGDTAVIEYDWTIIWRPAGQDQASTENGRETLVLAKRDGNWRAIWRLQLPGKSGA